MTIFTIFIHVPSYKQNYVEPSPTTEEASEEAETPTTPSIEETPQTLPERKTNFQKVVVTEVESCCHFWAQLADQGIVAVSPRN